MDTFRYILDALTLLAIAGFTLFVTRYLPSYFAEKGKNLATKEDVGNITRIVESVRSQHSMDLEVLKTAFQFASQERSNFTSDQRTAVLQFFDTCVDMVFGKLQTNLGDHPCDNGTVLVEYQTGVRELVVDIFKKYHRLIVFIEPSSELAKAAEAFVIHAGTFRREFGRTFGRVKLTLIEECAAMPDNTRYSAAVEASDAAAKKYHAAIGPSVKGMADALGRFLFALNKHLISGAGEAGLGALTETLKAAAEDFAPISHDRQPGT